LRPDPFSAGRSGSPSLPNENMQQHIFQFGSEPQNTTTPLAPSSHCSSVQERLATYGSEALTSNGKKLIVAVTALIFVLYVLGHLLGNLQIYIGQDRINAYAKFLPDLASILPLL
jgi:hypothetical protein